MSRTPLWAAAALLASLFAVPSAQAAAAPLTVADFESATVPAGVYPWGSDSASTPRLDITPAPDRPEAPAGNRALRAEYTVGQWGGWSHDLSAAQDWSAHEGLSFWVLGAATGRRVYFEVRDGGGGAGSAELFESSFVDDTAGWRQVRTPFAAFVRRADYQPAGAPTDGELDLVEMWGYALRFPAASGTLGFDDVQVYGTAPARPVRLSTDRPVYAVDERGSARVAVTVTTADGRPLPADTRVSYATGTGTATPGADYVPVAGTLTFRAGTPSGGSQAFTVRTLRDRDAEVAETVPVVLSGEGVRPPADEPAIVVNAHGLPYLDRSRPVRDRVRDLLSRMTVAEKVGQMTQAERSALGTPDDLATYLLGSVLSGGGSAPADNTPKAWADMVDGFQLRTRQTRLQIPIVYGVDAVHGHNNVAGATIFPHNVGLGATRDPALVRRIGAATAKEVKATGIPWNFSPCLCVSRDERWGRAYESFGEDPALVGRMSTIIDGLQDHGVLATAKHYVADGGTDYGSSGTADYTIDQGVFTGSREELEAVHLAPFAQAVRRGVGSVMPSFSSVGPTKMHAHRELLTDVLKGRLGFTGLVVSDWQAIDQIPGDHTTDVRTSINAGLDMIMVPYAFQTFVSTLTAEIEAGRVSMARVDDAVSRILTAKFRLGLFERPYADRSGLSTVGSAPHRALARTAAARSQVLLKNSGSVVPLRPSARVYVAGSNADDIGNQSGGWTITWQGSSGPITQGTTILSGIRGRAASVTHSPDASAPTAGHDVGVVVVGERPYAEGQGDVGRQGRTMELSPQDRAAVETVCGALDCVVVVVSGRPLLLGDLSQVEAVVAAWLPGSEGAGVSDPLFGAVPYTGRLPYTWPRSMEQLPINVGDAAYDPLYPYGWGLSTKSAPKSGNLMTEARRLEQAGGDTWAAADALVSSAREQARRTGVSAARWALADQALASGAYTRAVELLIR
ncbi:glycoside hydrolase family 3 N-terminal domain-containing protein [Nonomuraea longicatena]|uniref:beta-glucosidase n=1 Tax=Nonomuraea longicatena TaxID=83682 RepID=A0ABN1NMS7_9ACTN